MPSLFFHFYIFISFYFISGTSDHVQIVAVNFVDPAVAIVCRVNYSNWPKHFGFRTHRPVREVLVAAKTNNNKVKKTNNDHNENRDN